MEKNCEHLEDAEFLKANDLIAKGQHEEAEQVLRLGLEKAENERAEHWISLYLHALASLRLAQNKDSEALDFYQKADKVSKDFYTKLVYSRMLSSVYKDYDLAIKKALEALGHLPKKHQAVNEAYSIIGLCFLARHDKDKALRAFVKSLDVDFDKFKSSDSCDLTLVSELVGRKIYHRGILSYLNYILRRATKENNDSLVKVLDQLIALARETGRGQPPRKRRAKTEGR